QGGSTDSAQRYDPRAQRVLSRRHSRRSAQRTVASRLLYHGPMRALGLYAKRAAMLGLLAGTQLAAQNAQPAFENDQVLIGEKHGQPHDHKLNRVMIYIGN